MKNRIEIINYLISRFGYKSYLEIGLRNPNDCFIHINCPDKSSVDPGYESVDNFATFKMESDSFFELLSKGNFGNCERKWDIIFIDGLHKADQVLRDVNNSLNHLSDGGTIVLHDCNPPSEYYARCDYSDHSTNAGGFWNGTVWKTIYHLRCTNTNIDICVIDEDWGCGIIRRGSQPLLELENPFYEFDTFSESKQRHLNLIKSEEFSFWLDSPFYRIQKKRN